MNPKWDGIERRQNLRTEAETLVARFYPEQLDNHELPEKLLHELMVHKVELELQNEELRLNYISMQEMRDRYLDLYDFAPVGYITLNLNGLISEINLTGLALFDFDRTQMLNSKFTNRVANEEQDRWYLFFSKIMASATGEKQYLDLTLRRADESTFYTRLECLRWGTSDSQAVLRIALTEINTLETVVKVAV
ncbi:histidine kinase [Methylomonas sp. AM2-LC]|uniref:histidine kinase n=1 Tax=Methylomonas sp. AM2-LC TaxID=3153301 RepID=UPI0032632B54